MASQDQRPIANILSAIPPKEDIRRRIADNLQERQVLRQLLKLAEKRPTTTENRRG